MPTFKQQCQDNGTIEGIYNWSVPLYTAAELTDSCNRFAAAYGTPAGLLILLGAYNTALETEDAVLGPTIEEVGIARLTNTGPLAAILPQTLTVVAVPKFYSYGDGQLHDDVWMFAGDTNSWTTVTENSNTPPSSYYSGFTTAVGQAWQGLSSIYNTANDSVDTWAVPAYWYEGSVYIDATLAKNLSLFPNRPHATKAFDIAWAQRQLNILDLGYYDYDFGNVLPYVDASGNDIGESPTIIVGDAGEILSNVPTTLDYAPWYAIDMLEAAGKTVVRGVKYRRWYYPHHTDESFISSNIEVYDFSVEHQVVADIAVQDVHDDATVFTEDGTVAIRAQVPLLTSSAALLSTQLLAYHVAIDIHKYDKRTGLESLVYSQYLNCPILKHHGSSIAPIANPVNPPTLTLTGGSLHPNEEYIYGYSIVTATGETMATNMDTTAPSTAPGHIMTTTDRGVVVSFPRCVDTAVTGYNLYRWHDNHWYRKTATVAEAGTTPVTFTDTEMVTGWTDYSSTDPRPTINTTGSVSDERFYRVPIYSGSDTTPSLLDDCSRGEQTIRGYYSNGKIYASLASITNIDEATPGSWIGEWSAGTSKYLLHNTFLNLGASPLGDYHIKIRGKAKVIEKTSTTDFVPILRSAGSGYTADHGLYNVISSLIGNAGNNLLAEARATFANLGDGSMAVPVSSLAGYVGLTFDGTTYHGATIQTADLDTLVEYDFSVIPISAYSLTISTSHTLGHNPTISWHWNNTSAAPDMAFYKVKVYREGIRIPIGTFGEELYTREMFFVLPTSDTVLTQYTIEVTAVPVDPSIPVATDSLAFTLDPNIVLTDPFVFTNATLTATKALTRYQPIQLKLYANASDINQETPWNDKPAYVGVDKTNWVTQATPTLDAFEGEVQFYYKDGKIYTNVDIKALASHAVLIYDRLYDYVAVEIDLKKTSTVAPRLYEYHLACLPETPDLTALQNEAVAVTNTPTVQVPRGRVALRNENAL